MVLKKTQLIDWRIRSIRLMSLIALVAYPIGAALIGLSNLQGGVIAGYVLSVGAVLATIALTTSSLQNIVWGDPDQLDEYQMRLRARATGTAYLVLTILVLLAALCAGVSADAGWWHPAEFGEYNAVFWGFMLYAIVLPTLCLAWQSDSAQDAEG